MSPLEVMRLNKRWSRRDLAELSGVAAKTIRGIEEGESTPRDDTLCKLADAFDMQPGEFAAALRGEPGREAA